MMMVYVMVWVLWEYVSCPHKCPKRRWRWRLLKHEIQNTQKHGCDHNALIFGFYLQNHVTDFFEVGVLA
jgi:hypothetical protein